MKRIFRIGSDHTAKNYLEYLRESYLFLFLDRFSFKPFEKESFPKKIYCIDTGFYEAVGYKFSENTGKIMENAVAVELLRRKSYWQSDWEIYYFRDYQQREVDFVVKEGLDVKQLIQVTYASGRDEIEKREIRSLLKASDVLECKELFCITWDYESEEEVKGKKIKFVPLWKWLLDL